MRGGGGGRSSGVHTCYLLASLNNNILARYFTNLDLPVPCSVGMFLSSSVFPQLVSLSGAVVFALRLMMTSCSSSERLTNSFQICKHGNFTFRPQDQNQTSPYWWSSISLMLVLRNWWHIKATFILHYF